MFFVITASALALNAHFCQKRLAYFSRVLEMLNKIAHNQIAALFLEITRIRYICRLLADKVNKLKNKENSLSELLPDVRLLYGETPFARTPAKASSGIILSFPGIKSVISMNACFVMMPVNTCC